MGCLVGRIVFFLHYQVDVTSVTHASNLEASFRLISPKPMKNSPVPRPRLYCHFIVRDVQPAPRRLQDLGGVIQAVTFATLPK